jgi:hypothetical protein
VMATAKRLAIQFCGTALLFSAFVSLTTSGVLLFASSIGYLPYSDRPGPGWWGHVHWPSLAEIGTYLGFAPWFAYFCLYFGVGFFLLSLVLGVASTPKWFTRIIAGVIGALAASLSVASAGWYLALAAIGPNCAMVAGLIYGVFLFPRFVVPREQRLAIWQRSIAITAASAVFILWIVWPLLPRKPVPGMAVLVNRVAPGQVPVDWKRSEYFRAETWDELSNLHLTGELHGGIQSAMSGEGQEIEVAVIALQPIDREYRVALPSSGHVVYVLHDGRLEPHPAFTKKDKRTMVLKPGLDPKWDGGQINLGHDCRPFTWYPAISH